MVREILINSAVDLGLSGKDKEYGYGLLNIEKALELTKEKLTSRTKQDKTNSVEIKSWIKR